MSEITSKGLELDSSKEMRSLLQNASTNEQLSEDLREQAKQLSKEQHIKWRQLRPVYNAIRELRQQTQSGEAACTALRTSQVVIPELKEKVKSPELVARLEKLQRQEDDRQYQAMVADITATERKADAAKDNALVSYKDQLGYGVHIVVVMGVFYLMGHLIAASISAKTSMRAAGGLTGLIIAMFVEAILLIIRTSGHHEKYRRKKSTFLSTTPAAQQQPLDNLARSKVEHINTSKKEK